MTVGVAAATGAVADVPAVGAAALAAAADRAFALDPEVAVGAVAASVVCADRRLFADPLVGAPVPVAAPVFGAPDPAACVCSPAPVDAAARAADFHLAADSMLAELTEADHCAAHLAAACWAD